MMNGCELQQNKANQAESIQLNLPEIKMRKRSESSCSSTDSDSGYKRSEVPSSSTLDTESLLTFSSCNLSGSEKPEETFNDITNATKYELKNEHYKSTRRFQQPLIARQSIGSPGFLKSRIHGINDLKELKSYVEFKANVNSLVKSSNRPTPFVARIVNKFTSTDQRSTKRLKMSESCKSFPSRLLTHKNVTSSFSKIKKLDVQLKGKSCS